jgi:hypothetical protein
MLIFDLGNPVSRMTPGRIPPPFIFVAWLLAA